MAVTTKGCASFGAPEVMPVKGTANEPELSSTLKLGIVSSVGGSLTGSTMTANVIQAESSFASTTITSMMHEPQASLGTARFRERLIPVPLIKIFVSGTIVSSEENT